MVCWPGKWPTTYAGTEEGSKVIAPGDKPYKLVEGKEGSRKWVDERVAETALVGQLGSI